MISLSQKTLKQIYLFFPIIVVLFPTFPQRFELTYIIFIGSFVFLVFFTCIGVYKISLNNISIIYVLLFTLLTLISLLCDSINDYTVLNDWFELARPIVFFFFYMFYRRANLNIHNLEKTTIKAIIIIFTILSIYSFLEFLFPNIFERISFLLYKREYMRVLKNKATGSFGQIYQYAYILILPLSYSLISLLRKISLKNFSFFLLLLMSLLLTQSRSMYISLGVCFAIIFCLPYFYRNISSINKTIFLFIFISSGILYLYMTYYDWFYNTFTYAFEGLDAIAEGTNGSVITRSKQIEWAFNNNKFILIGSGISKKIIMLESFYSLYLYRYGIIGMTTFLIIVLVTAIKSYRIAILEYNNTKISCFYLSLFIFYLTTPVSILSSCHHDTPKISLLFYGLIGFIFHKYSLLKR